MIVLNIGIPPATEASNSKFVLFSSAILDNESPCLAINALFGVITLILFLRAYSTIFFDIPSDCPMHSNKISIFFSLKIFIGFVKKIFLSILKRLFLFLFFAEIATILIFFPVLISFCFFFNLS